MRESCIVQKILFMNELQTVLHWRSSNILLNRVEREGEIENVCHYDVRNRHPARKPTYS